MVESPGITMSQLQELGGNYNRSFLTGDKCLSASLSLIHLLTFAPCLSYIDFRSKSLDSSVRNRN